MNDKSKDINELDSLTARGMSAPTTRGVRTSDTTTRGIRIEVIPEVVLKRHFHGGNLSFDRPADPSEHPLLRSLKAKLERDRDSAAQPPEEPR